MLYLLNKDVRTVRWNGEPLHEATSAIVKETMNGDFTLTVKYPISDSGIYQLIQEDMLIKAPTPVSGAQLFRIKKPVEHNDHLVITAYHISDDVMQRSITPMSVTSQSCGMALSRMVQNTKTALGDFSFNSDIQDRRTFNTTETETLYSVLLDGKHSIVGTWEGELIRDNFALTVKKSRGENRGVVITTHKNLKDYQRTRNSQNVVTRIHAKSTFKPEGAEKETTIRVTVDSPLINSYPYINEKEYENNNSKSVEELQKWAQAKFSNEGIDKVSDAIKIEAYELDGQVVHMGDTVNLKSWKHNVDAFKKAIAYEFDALKEEYISLTFDDKAGAGGSRASGGLSSAADAILGVTESAQEIALEKALQNADLDFDHKAGLLRHEISDGIELAKARAEEVKRELSATIDQRFNSFNNGPLQEAKRRAEEALRNAGASTLLAQEAKRIGLDSVAKLEEFKRQATSAQTALSGDLDALKRTVANDIRPKQAQAEAEIYKQVEALVQTKKELAGVKSAQSTFEQSTTRRLSELTNLANGKASKSELTQTAEELTSKIASVQVGGRNLYALSKNLDILKGGHVADLKMDISSGEISFKATGPDPYVGEATTHPKTASGRNGVRIPVIIGKSIYVTISNPVFAKNFISYFDERGSTVKHYQYYNTNSFVISPKELAGVSFVTLRFGCGGSSFEIGDVLKTKVKVEYGTIPTDWSPAPEDVESQISAVESSFKQRADALDAGVSRLTEGLRTKADISSLNVTAENIRQSVKSLETSTQNKLDQKLSLAEFEVRASSIRQEILNATKDKADKTLVVSEAGKLREEFSNLRVGGRNLIRNYDWNGLLPLQKLGTDWKFERIADENAKSGYSLKATCTQGGAGGFYKHLFDLRANEFQGKDMTWSWDMKSSRSITFNVMGFEAGGLKRNVPVSTEWTRITNTFKVAFKELFSCVFYSFEWKVGDVVYIRDPQLEEGTIATTPKRAPEDTDGLITEAKATFERTAQGLRTELSAIQEYVNKDGQRQEALRRYSREESAKQATAVRELVARDYVGKSTYQEDVRGIERRFEAITNPQNGSIATQIANYKTAVDGRFTDITSLISGKANQTDFQRVKETSQLYERILGNTDNGIANNIARMAMTNQLFQVEVSKNENLKTVQRQLAGSWGVHNKNSVNEIIAGFNLAGRNAGIKAETIRLEGKTLLDELTAIQGYFKRLFVGEGTFATLNADVIRTNSITADKLVFNEALANRLVSNEIITSKLVASRAFVNALNAVTIDASQIVTGTLKGDRIYGGTIRGTNIYGGTLTGHTKIQLGSYGSFDTVNGGLQINVPRDYNAKDGLGVQFIGSYGRGENVPYGLFIYKDSDFTVGGTVETSNEFLLTVEGYIQANGIGWMRTGKGSVNGQTTATIGLWNSENVSLDFGGSGNDIYYSYNGTAYSLWSVVNQHFSDRRLKENIVDCKHKALDYIQQFQFKEYDWKKQEDRPQQEHTKIGLIAQEVQAVDPALVYENGDTLNLDNLRLTNIALKAIQELALENRKLTHRLENLENEYRTA